MDAGYAGKSIENISGGESMSERIKEVSLVDRINDLLSSSILRLHGPNKNHDDCFHCQLIIDLKKIRQALTAKEAELQAEREKVREMTKFIRGQQLALSGEE